MTRKDFIPTPDDHGLIALKARLVNAKPVQLGLLVQD